MIDYIVLEDAHTALGDATVKGSKLNEKLQPVVEWLEEHGDDPDDLRAARLHEALQLGHNPEAGLLIESVASFRQLLDSVMHSRHSSKSDRDKARNAVGRWRDRKKALDLAS